ncbi:MAG: lysophospholipid acyltransferase family protein [Myxococcales bacterium]|nr:acyltransferase family protein [Myxococcota bacterium]MDW8284149.1 lysophospholipid acyltransferase family protein [Myxococcales bacterium]
MQAHRRDKQVRQRAPTPVDADAPPRQSTRPPQELLFDPVLVRKVERALRPILRHYFRGEVRGLERIPSRQTIIIANHDGGMLPVDGMLFGAEWHRLHACQRPLHILVHDMVMALFGPWRNGLRRLGCVLADRQNLDAVLDAGHSVLIYPGGSRETFRSFFERKTITLGGRTGFVRHALRRRVPITPVVSVGAHETFFVLWRGAWLADRLGITRRFRADVFPIVAGLPFGIWLGAGIPHLPLPAKITMQVLPPIDLHAEVTAQLGREPCAAELSHPELLRMCFERVRSAMQRELDRLYAERKFPILG